MGGQQIGPGLERQRRRGPGSFGVRLEEDHRARVVGNLQAGGGGADDVEGRLVEELEAAGTGSLGLARPLDEAEGFREAREEGESSEEGGRRWKQHELDPLDDAQRALGADEEVERVLQAPVAGGRLAVSAARERQALAVREDDVQAPNPVPRGAPAQGAGSRGVRGHGPSQRALFFARRIGRVVRTGPFDGGLQLGEDHPGFGDRDPPLGIDVEDPVQSLEREHGAAGGEWPAYRARAHPGRRQRLAAGGAVADDRGELRRVSGAPDSLGDEAQPGGVLRVGRADVGVYRAAELNHGVAPFASPVRFMVE